MTSITVGAKVAGQRRPLVPDWEVPLPAAVESGGTVTLRELLAHVVRQEVEAFRERREARRLTQVLSREQIEQSALSGQVRMGGREDEPDVDPEQAVETALLAFQDGLYYVFVDEQQVTELDAPVPLRAASRLMFLRLVALAGG